MDNNEKDMKRNENNSQGQINDTAVKLPENLSQFLKVKPAEKKEIEEKEYVSETLTKEVGFRSDISRKRIDIRKFKAEGLNKYIDDYKLHQYNLIKNAKISMEVYEIDPISSYYPLFDGYIKTPKNDIFIEVKNNIEPLFYIKDRLYFMLSKIYYYGIIKNLNASLVLILITTKEDKLSKTYYKVNRFFEPAITSGLLKIIEYTVDELESSNIYRDEI
ncbi:hypothetical protein [Methanococcoides sp. FTZ1]|uniref:hypothetical protein n=1 Tax=Methanococcoides sp. FTZ1 TaxID=3439061 RepID=UPI003F8413F5